MEARLNGISFSQIEQEKIKWHIDQIMLRGAAISGCALPNTEFFAEIIGDELYKFIIEFGYADYAYEEILLALMLNSKGNLKYPSGDLIEPIPFYGNCFNIDYFSKVMQNYDIVRNILDRKFQNIIDGY